MVTLAIYDYSNNKVMDLYATNSGIQGQAYDVVYSEEINGWKEISFRIATMIEEDGKQVKNFRIEYVKNEYLVKYTDGDKEDWFIINLPAGAHDSSKYMVVTCGHISSLLNRKKLYLVLDDTNGIGTAPYLAALVLQNTGWEIGEVDVFLEADGQTEKVRSITSDGKEGAYQLISRICETFHARPVYHGDTKKVDILSLNRREKIVEFTYQKNMKSVRVENSSQELITRMYVEGIYDQYGYIGIDDVNPTGLNFLLNFDYFRELGLLTPTHETAINTYTDEMKDISSQISATQSEISKETNDLNLLWGVNAVYVVWPVTSNYSTRAVNVGPLVTNSPRPDLLVGEEVVVCLKDNTYKRAKLTAKTNTRLTVDQDVPNAKYVIRFMQKAAGVIGGKEVAIEAKQASIARWEKQLETAISEATIKSLQEQIAETQTEINNILVGTSEAEGLYTQMDEAAAITFVIDGLETQMRQQVYTQSTIEDRFVNAMGDLLRDGYWNDSNYVPGQELALYSDALEIMNYISGPLATYSIDYVDLSGMPGYGDEDIEIDTAIHVIDKEIQLNDYCFVTKVTRYPDTPWKNKADISNQLINIAGHSFNSVLSRITELADQINGRKAIFERAAIIGADDTLPTQVLNGIIDITKNMLLSTSSNWWTDENGNIMFEALDGQSAMMLTGAGFMIASGKDETGEWIWRTFGTGKGFTADEIIAGEIRTGLVRILGTDRFYWDQSNIYIIDPLNTDRQIRIGLYDGQRYGIGFTQDGGITWQNAIGFDGVTLSTKNITEITNQLQSEFGGVILQMDIPSGDQLDKTLRSTTLSAKVIKGGYDITSKITAANFDWTRKSDRTADDTSWNNSHKARKSVPITGDDVDFRAVFSCRLNLAGVPDAGLTGYLYVRVTIIDREDDPYIDEVWTEFTLTNEQIALKASQTQVDQINGQVSQNTAAININAQQIALKVSTSDFVRSAIEPINNVVVGTVWYDTTREVFWQCTSLSSDPVAGTRYTWKPTISQKVITSGITIENDSVLISSPNVLFELLNPNDLAKALISMTSESISFGGVDGQTKFFFDLITGDLTMEGIINADAGRIGGFTIHPNGLYSDVTDGTQLIISKAGNISAGIVQISPTGGIWVQHPHQGTDVFSVDENSTYIGNQLIVEAPTFFDPAWLGRTTLPPNLRLDTTTKELQVTSWTPGSSASMSASISVSPSSIYVNGSASVSVSASGGTSPYSYVIEIYRNGSYLRTETNGGTFYPGTYTGSYVFYLTATDYYGNTARATSNTLTVNQQTSNLYITTSVSSISVTVGTQVTFSASASGATGSVSWQYELYFNGSRVAYESGNYLSPSFQSTGTAYVIFTASDSLTTKQEQTQTVTITSGGGGGGTSYAGYIRGSDVAFRTGPGTNYGTTWPYYFQNGQRLATTSPYRAVSGSGGNGWWWPVRFVSSEPEEYYGYVSDMYFDPD